MAATTTRAEIQDFLSHKRLAVIGVSRDSKDFGNGLYRELRRRGYEAIPVNPNAQVLEGERCFANVREIQPAPEAALVLTSTAASEQIVQECAEAGVKQVWLYGVSGPASVNARAIEVATSHGMKVIPGYCVYMFLPGSAFYHRAHGFVARLTGTCPN